MSWKFLLLRRVSELSYLSEKRDTDSEIFKAHDPEYDLERCPRLHEQAIRRVLRAVPHAGQPEHFSGRRCLRYDAYGARLDFRGSQSQRAHGPPICAQRRLSYGGVYAGED